MHHVGCYCCVHALYFQAAIILSLQAKAWDYWYKKYLVHIHTNCNPIFKYYDDDDLPMPVQNGNQLQETTARNKVSCICKLILFTVTGGGEGDF